MMSGTFTTMLTTDSVSVRLKFGLTVKAST